jgi:predicted RNA-binding Zn ribbon-like protein
MAEVPEGLWLAESFLNSVDVESASDDLDSVPRFRRWLGDHGRMEAAASATADELTLAHDLRHELRNLLSAHTAGATVDTERLSEIAAKIPLRASFDGDATLLGPAVGGVQGVLGDVLGAVVLAGQNGTWQRLKLCRETTCRVVFYDRSKNASRCWCSMRVCGNRNKTRAYRRRASAAL